MSTILLGLFAGCGYGELSFESSASRAKRLSDPFPCTESAGPGVTNLRRLTRREYVLTLQDLMLGQMTLDDIDLQLSNLPGDTVTGIFDTQDSFVSRSHVDAYLDIAQSVSQQLVTKPDWLDSVLACPFAAQGMTDACWNGFFNRFGRLVYRRPLTAAEKSAYQALYNDQSGGSVPAGLQAVTSAMLQSPYFQYHVENAGTPIPGKPDLLQLTDYELASRLAFLATGRAPDIALLDDAAVGRLKTESGFREVAARVFATEEARKHVEQFYTLWLGLTPDRLAFPSAPASFAGDVPLATLRDEAKAEVEEFTARLTWDVPGTYRDLMTSEETVIRGEALSAVYGTTPGSSGPGSTPAPLTIEAEGMIASVGGAAPDGWNIWSEGTLTRSISLIPGMDYQVNVRARASLAEDVGAEMEVRFDSQVIGTATVTAEGQYADHVFTFRAQRAAGDLVVEFGNDFFDPVTNEDRNLFVDKVVLTAVPSGVSRAPARLTALPRGQHPGILSRAAMLLSNSPRTSVVHRGLIVRRNFLCETINPPTIEPGEADLFAPPLPDVSESQRHQIEARTSPPKCQACHAKINPMGFALENYDSLGRFQTIEKVLASDGTVLATHTVDARVKPNIDNKNEPDVTGLAELAESMARSRKGPACLAKQWLTFSTGREPDRADNCALSQVYEALVDASEPSASGDTPATLLNMFKSSAFEPGFRLRRVGSL